jgi:signal transduction histidine kinase/response regulator RpfG family c-di-GMP phosphodiesterase
LNTQFFVFSFNALLEVMMQTQEKVKILIVDDLSEKLLVYRTVLEELGEELHTASSGEDALRLVLQHDFAVILLDVNMPGMDGLETASLIRQRSKSRYTPIIFATAFLDEFRSQQGYAHGAVDYILAPIDPVILRAKVKVFVDLFRMRREIERRAEERVTLAEERGKRLAAEEAHRVSSFLAHASKELSQCQILPEIMNQLVHLVVPSLGDGCMVCVTNGNECQLQVSAWKQTSMKSMEEELFKYLQDAIDDAMSQGTVQWKHVPPDVWRQHAPLVSVSDVLIHPLQARGKALGALILLQGSPLPGKDNTALLEDLASRAAVTIDNALLLQHIREVDHRKDEFLAILAHELRNPLAPLRNALSILQMKEEKNAVVQDAASMINRQLTQLTRLVDDLLDVARITTGKIKLSREKVNLLNSVLTAIEATRHHVNAKKQQLTVNLPQQPLFLLADPVRLTQIIANLLNNATKYTGHEGSITLTVSHTDRMISITIKDTGEGIPPTMRHRIFELFTQVDESAEKSHGGLGIGLTLVKKFVDLHEGNIEVNSPGVGQGSEFIVSFPFIEALQSAESDVLADRSIAPTSRVLVVDDNVDAAESMAMLLELLKMEVVTANSGKDAITQAEKVRPATIFLDIGMPGMNGYEVARAIRAQPWGQSIKLIALTGWGQEEDRQLSHSAGFDLHLVKPIEITQIKQVLEKV